MSVETRPKRWIAAVAIAALALTTIGGTTASAEGGGPGEAGCDTNHVKVKSGKVIVSPNGVDDTENVTCAIETASAYGGKTVQLTKSTFHLDFVFVEEFDGRIRGSGRDHTTIEPLEGGLDCVATFEEFGFVFWLVFLDSNPTITDLSLSIPDVACVEPYLEVTEVDPDTGEVVFQGAFQDFQSMVLVPTRSPAPTPDCGVAGHIGLKAKRIDVDAPIPDFGAEVFNPQGAFNSFFVVGTTPEGCDVQDHAVGDVIVTDVRASGVGNLIEAQGVTDSRIKVVRNHAMDLDVAVLLFNNEGTTARVSHNTIERGFNAGIVSDSCSRPEPGFCVARSSDVTISHNDIHMSEMSGPAIVAVDGGPGEPNMEARVRTNHISGDGFFAGVLLIGADGDRVSRNTIDGSSVFGVLAEAGTTSSKIVDNDLTGHLAFEAGILLDPSTSMNVVKRNAGATVVDLGTDNEVESDVAATSTTASATTEPTARASASTEVATDWPTASNWSNSDWSRR